MLALNPASLFLAGPQLSFLAVATMIAFQPLLIPQPIDDPLDRLIATTRPWLVRPEPGDGRCAVASVADRALIWLVSTPLVWKQYHLISPVALVLNFLMWLPVTLAMYSGLGTLLLGSLAPVWPAGCAALTCDGALDLLERLIVWGRDWPASYFWLAAPPGWWIGLFYVALGLFVCFPALRPPRHWLIGADCDLDCRRGVACRVWPNLAAATSGQRGRWLPLRRRRPRRRRAGRTARRPQSAVRRRPPRLAAGRRAAGLVGALVARHHASRRARHLARRRRPLQRAFPGLLDRFSVGAIYVSPVMFERLPPAVDELRDAIDRSQRARCRDFMPASGCLPPAAREIEVLHPPAQGVIGSDNANSIVLLIEHAGRRMLLTGDLEPPGLEERAGRASRSIATSFSPRTTAARAAIPAASPIGARRSTSSSAAAAARR